MEDCKEWKEWDFLMHQNQNPGAGRGLMLVPEGSR
jgi:hypothetical protein